MSASPRISTRAWPHTGIFNVQDAVQNRNIMGIARVNLAKKDVDFYPLGPARVSNFSHARPKMGYGLFGDQRVQFWSFDLEHRSSPPHQFGPPRMAPENQFQRQSALHLPGRQHHRSLMRHVPVPRTISLDADMTTGLYVMPALEEVFDYAVPTWLVLVLVLILLSTGLANAAVSLGVWWTARCSAAIRNVAAHPRAIVGDGSQLPAQYRAGFGNARTAEILFDMRSVSFEHLQRLSPRLRPNAMAKSSAASTTISARSAHRR
jgi:hypothetical protein